ncbi:hypothetical protein BKA80DRAFT_59925 [Phyllosticta citrichinensis]
MWIDSVKLIDLFPARKGLAVPLATPVETPSNAPPLYACHACFWNNSSSCLPLSASKGPKAKLQRTRSSSIQALPMTRKHHKKPGCRCMYFGRHRITLSLTDQPNIPLSQPRSTGGGLHLKFGKLSWNCSNRKHGSPMLSLSDLPQKDFTDPPD